jgi:hypothetical protein
MSICGSVLTRVDVLRSSSTNLFKAAKLFAIKVGIEFDGVMNKNILWKKNKKRSEVLRIGAT